MRVLVTGGAGFAGSHYVRHVLATTSDEVTVLDALSYAGRPENLDDVREDPRFRFLRGDVVDEDTVRRAVRGHDAVVHFAGESHVDRSLVHPDVFVRTNCLGTAVLCRVATEEGVRRFVHVSTDEVYGPVVEASVDESSPLRPRTPYSSSKAAGELVAVAYHHSHGLPVVVTRASNQYGPHQFPEKFVPFFVTSLLRGRRLPLHGDGGNVRDWLHVNDGARAVDLVLRRGRPGSVYNVAAGNELTTAEVTGRILQQLGAGWDRVVHVPDRLANDRRYSMDAGRLRALGWEPSVPFDRGLAETVEWYRANESWWRPLVPVVDRFCAGLPWAAVADDALGAEVAAG